MNFHCKLLEPSGGARSVPASKVDARSYGAAARAYVASNGPRVCLLLGSATVEVTTTSTTPDGSRRSRVVRVDIHLQSKRIT